MQRQPEQQQCQPQNQQQLFCGVSCRGQHMIVTCNCALWQLLPWWCTKTMEALLAFAASRARLRSDRHTTSDLELHTQRKASVVQTCCCPCTPCNASNLADDTHPHHFPPLLLLRAEVCASC
jgi:hypothetical protein